MGFFSNLWHSITTAVEVLINVIIRPAIQWIIDAIEDITAELRYWKHEALKKLAEWLENDWFFLFAVVVTITAAVYWPKIVSFLKGLKIVAWLKGIMEAVKKAVAGVLDFIHFLDLKLISDMLKIVWPEWRRMMGELANVTSALAEELGQGSGYIHAYFSLIHTSALLGHSLLGVEPELAELQAFEQTNDFLATIDERFQEYAHDPGAIVRDIIEDVYLPNSRIYYDSQAGLIEGVRKNYDYYLRLDKSVADFGGALQHFIDVQPEEMAEVISRRLQPFADSLEQYRKYMYEEIYLKVEGIAGLLEQREKDIFQINYRLLALTDDPYNTLRSYETIGKAAQKRVEDIMAEIAGETIRRHEPEIAETVVSVGTLFSDLMERSAEEYGKVRVLSFEPIDARPVAGVPSVKGKSWFQGEY